MEGATLHQPAVLFRSFLAPFLPALKPVDLEVMFPIQGIATDTTAGLLVVSQQILTATTNGTLTPEQGQKLAALLEWQHRLMETTELEQRVAALEGVTK